MTRARKLLAAVMAAFAAFAMAASVALADGYTITITNAVDGQTYSAYKIFDVTTTNDESTSYAYTMDAGNEGSAQRNLFNRLQAKFPTLFTQIDGTSIYNVTGDAITGTTEDDRAQAVAAVVKDWLAANAGVVASGIVTANDTTATINLTEPGYYFVNSQVGSLCVVDTFTGSAMISDKNSAPTVDKKVAEVTDHVAGVTYDKDTADAAIGDTVPYKVTVQVKDGATNYVLHDVFPAGVTFDAATANIAVTADGVRLTADTDYTVTVDPGDGDTFDITFNGDGWKVAGKELTVEYSGVLNESAVVAGDGNVNKVWLTYGNNIKSNEDTATVKTWQIEVVKVEKNNEAKKLEGATFVLSSTENEFDAIKFKNAVGTTDYVRAVNQENTTAVSSITTTASGTFMLKGLDSGTYYLIETAAPSGYSRLTKPVKVTIDENGAISIDGDQAVAAGTTVKVENSTGAELPSTGGMGTTIFYVVGGILVVGAVVLLVTKKKMANK